MKISNELAQQLRKQAEQDGLTVEELLTVLLKDYAAASKPAAEESEALRLSEARLQGLLESEIDLVCRYTPDTILTFVNDAYCKHFGLTRAELLGKSFLMLADEAQHAAIRQRIEEVKQDPSSRVRVFGGVDLHDEQTWIQWIDYGITDTKGSLIEIQAVGRNVTELINAQYDLLQQQEVLQTIFDSIPIMIALFGSDGRFEYVNQHWVEVLGWGVDEMNAQTDMLSLFYPDPEVRRTAISYMAAAEPGWRDFEVMTRSGKPIETTWANVRLSDGRSIGIGQVITHRKELERQILYAEQLELELRKEQELMEVKERFISMVSHEYRTPLTVINIYLDLLTRNLAHWPPNELLDKLGKIRQQAERMKVLLEDILRFSKGRAGKTEFYPQTFLLLSFCKDVVEEMRSADQDSHQIVVSGDEGIIYCDPKLLQHILANLISNALKYSAAGEIVTVNVRHQNEYWHIAVKDQGIGIPADEIDTLFEPFARASNAQHHPGTGLGLVIVKEYVEQHQGQIWVESVENEGSTFVVELPVAPAEVS